MMTYNMLIKENKQNLDQNNELKLKFNIAEKAQINNDSEMIKCEFCLHRTNTHYQMDNHLFMFHNMKNQYSCNDKNCHTISFDEEKCLETHKLAVPDYHIKQCTENESKYNTERQYKQDKMRNQYGKRNENITIRKNITVKDRHNLNSEEVFNLGKSMIFWRSNQTLK